MLRDLLTFPVRIGLVATRFGFRLTEQAVILGWRTTERLLKDALPFEPPATHESASAPDAFELGVIITTAPTPTRPARSSRPARKAAGSSNGQASAAPAAPPAAPAVPAAPTAATQSPLPQAAPAHISAEPEFVEAFAEPGAEEGAGAAVHIDEPWHGYAQMPANAVIARLSEASPEELAVVELYEGTHRRRKTVLTAAQRGLKG
jgi:hypothetical protein